MQVPSQASIWARWAEMRESWRVVSTILLFTSARLLVAEWGLSYTCYRRADASLKLLELGQVSCGRDREFAGGVVRQKVILAWIVIRHRPERERLSS